MPQPYLTILNPTYTYTKKYFVPSYPSLPPPPPPKKKKKKKKKEIKSTLRVRDLNLHFWATFLVIIIWKLTADQKEVETDTDSRSEGNRRCVKDEHFSKNGYSRNTCISRDLLLFKTTDNYSERIFSLKTILSFVPSRSRHGSVAKSLGLQLI